MSTVKITYWHNGNLAYWTLKQGDSDLLTFCANTYATFKGDRIGEHQVMGWASSPINTPDMRAWFKRQMKGWCAPYDRISIRRVKDIGDLPCAD